MVDNGLHQTMLFHSPCYRETIDHRQGNFSPQIQLSRIKVYQCYQETPCSQFLSQILTSAPIQVGAVCPIQRLLVSFGGWDPL